MPISERLPQLNAAILGAGSIGKRHLRNLQLLGHTVSSVFDPDPGRRAEVESEFGVPAVSSLDEALDRGANAAFVCSPTSFHLSQASMAIDADHHVFIEKPIAPTLAGVPEFAAKLERSGKIALVGCNLRFLSSLVRAKKLADDGAIGRVRWGRAEFGFYLPYWHPWEDYRQSYSARKDLGGGILLDAIHELDYLTWFMGEVNEVSGTLENSGTLGIETEDIAEAVLKTRDGSVGQIHLDYLQRRFCRSLRLVGEAGVLEWDFVSQTVRVYKERERAEVWDEGINTDRNVMYLDQLRHFSRCVSGEERPMVGVERASQLLEMVEAIRISAAERRAVRLERTGSVAS